MKKTIITTLLTLVAMAGQAQQKFCGLILSL